MKHYIMKHGFCYCGIIYLASGDERLAYQNLVESGHFKDFIDLGLDMEHLEAALVFYGLPHDQ